MSNQMLETSEDALPENAGATHDDIRRATEILKSVADDRGVLAGMTEEERIAFLHACGRVANPDRSDRRRLAKRSRRLALKAQIDHDRAARALTEIRAVRREAVFAAPLQLIEVNPTGPRPVLQKPRCCYVCKVEFQVLHHFYDAMCKECGDLNYTKRFQSASLEGKVALITGARVKIGFQAALMMLRAGAQVIVSTRFPHDAAERYAREEDFPKWKDRLSIHGLDLRHAPSVEIFARYVESTHSRLDILINNAAQTVRRPPGFYAHLSELESRAVSDLSKDAQKLLAGHVACVESLRSSSTLTAGSTAPLTKNWRSSDPALGIHSSAALSQLPYVLEQDDVDALAIFPQGKLDADLQQVDLRALNTWRLTLSQVATAELLEVYLINAVAPFILCGKLKGLMERDRTEPGHIVNVSAMEGSFSRRTKTDKHPHTNMAKAALNMMTATSAQDYAKTNIYMNAADTGWVTDEDPVLFAERKVRDHDFQPPLDIVDGAARVIDPVFTALRTGQYVYGKFFKDYRETDW